jgi:hypothetical protein
MKLWLDDVREPWRFGCVGWEWVKTADEAIEKLKTGTTEIASLDHDLGIEQTLAGMQGLISNDNGKSGYDVVLWLEQNPNFWPPYGVRVHSANPAGKARMEQVIRRYYGRNF